METRPTGQSAMLEELDVDSFLRHITLSQQRAQERRRVIQEVQAEVSVCHEKISEVKKKTEEANDSLERTVGRLLERHFERQLLGKRQESLEAQRERLLTERHQQRAQLERLSRDLAEEEEKFLEEVEAFNANYGLTSNREEQLSVQSKAEAHTLDLKADTLRREITSLKRDNLRLNALQAQKEEAQQELRALQQTLRDVEEKISSSVSITKSLEEEKVSISEKPQKDAECLRLKKELDSHKDGHLREACEALCMEIDFLQRKSLEAPAETNPLP